MRSALLTGPSNAGAAAWLQPQQTCTFNLQINQANPAQEASGGGGTCQPTVLISAAGNTVDTETGAVCLELVSRRTSAGTSSQQGSHPNRNERPLAPPGGYSSRRSHVAETVRSSSTRTSAAPHAPELVPPVTIVS